MYPNTVSDTESKTQNISSVFKDHWDTNFIQRCSLHNYGQLFYINICEQIRFFKVHSSGKKLLKRQDKELGLVL